MFSPDWQPPLTGDEEFQTWFAQQELFTTNEGVIGKIRSPDGDEVHITGLFDYRMIRVVNPTTGKGELVSIERVSRVHPGFAPEDLPHEEIPSDIDPLFDDQQLIDLRNQLLTQGSRRMHRSMNDEIRTRGGNPKHKIDKSGGRGLKG